MRESDNQLDADYTLISGYDYTNQAWVIDGKYIRCGHPDSMDCGCYGREHEGELVQRGHTGN